LSWSWTSARRGPRSVTSESTTKTYIGSPPTVFHDPCGSLPSRLTLKLPDRIRVAPEGLLQTQKDGP
jgi:hypothetical protein